MTIEEINSQILQLAYDPLTNCYVKKIFDLLVYKDLPNRKDTTTGYIFFCDLNDINSLNNIYKREKVNNYIKNIYLKLSEIFADIPETNFCRMGDEFLIYSPNCTEDQMHEMDFKVKSIRSVVNNSISTGNVSIHDESCNYSLDKLLSKADTHMQEYKRGIKQKNLAHKYSTKQEFAQGVLSSMLDKLRIDTAFLTPEQINSIPDKIIDIFKHQNMNAVYEIQQEHPLSAYFDIFTEISNDSPEYSSDMISRLATLKYLQEYTKGIYTHEHFTKIAHSTITDKHTNLTFLDVTFLKEINDTRGHAYADKQILDVAHLLTDTFANMPGSIIVKRGAGEFYVISEDLTKEQIAALDTARNDYNDSHNLHLNHIVHSGSESLQNEFLQIVDQCQEEMLPINSTIKFHGLDKCSSTIYKMIAPLAENTSKDYSLADIKSSILTVLTCAQQISHKENDLNLFPENEK